MIEVVCDPGRQELTQRHDAESGVPPAAIEVGFRQVERRQSAKRFRSKRGKLVQQAGERSSLGCSELSEAIERVEGTGFALFQNNPRAPESRPLPPS